MKKNRTVAGVVQWRLTLTVAFAVATICIASLHSAGDATGNHILRGSTMGTSYSITLRGKLPLRAAHLHDLINQRLEQIESTFSTWRNNSELSKFNQAQHNDWIDLSPELYKLLTAAQRIARSTQGHFDITIGPLVNLWGYGPDTVDSTPSGAQIEDVMKRIGYRHLELEKSMGKKSVPEMYLDLSGIAKGYGVDVIGQLLSENGLNNFLVEIGGEVLAKTDDPGAAPWIVAIEQPENTAIGADRQIVRQLQLQRGALATSGSYRQYREHQQGTTHHIINPKSGTSNISDLVAVTVYADNCMQADAIATALMTMGVKQGLTWIEQREGLEALFQQKNSEGFTQIMSTGFGDLL